MDGENHGSKPYEQMEDLEAFPIICGGPPICWLVDTFSIRALQVKIIPTLNRLVETHDEVFQRMHGAKPRQVLYPKGTASCSKYEPTTKKNTQTINKPNEIHTNFSHQKKYTPEI